MPKRPPAPPAPSAELTEYLAGFAPAVRDLALQVREHVLRRDPGLVETVRPGWDSIAFGTSDRMADTVVSVGPARAHVSLHFLQGASLPDPDGLLEGSGRLSRHVKLRTAADLAAPAVQRLVAAAFDRQEGATTTPTKVATKAPKQSAAKTPVRSAAGSAAAASAAWTPPVADATVAEKTGRDWSDWLTTLDAFGCTGMAHPDIVRLIAREFPDVTAWWRQTITVGYERARGQRAAHETPAGYQVGVSRMIAAPVADLWRAWTDARTRKRWLADPFTVRRATEAKSLRITWHDGTDLQVLFTAKGDAKSQVTVDHRRLADAARVDAMRAYWQERLAVLRGMFAED